MGSGRGYMCPPWFSVQWLLLRLQSSWTLEVLALWDLFSYLKAFLINLGSPFFSTVLGCPLLGSLKCAAVPHPPLLNGAIPKVLSLIFFSSFAVFSFWVISSHHIASPFTPTLMIPQLTSPILNSFWSSRLTPISNGLLSTSRAGYPRRKCSLAFVILPQEYRWGSRAWRSSKSWKQGRRPGTWAEVAIV